MLCIKGRVEENEKTLIVGSYNEKEVLLMAQDPLTLKK